MHLTVASGLCMRASCQPSCMQACMQPTKHPSAACPSLVQLACQGIPDSPCAIAHLDPDTAISHASFHVALRAAAAVCVAVDAVVAGEAANAFCAVRPPGHHAGPRGVVASKKDPNGSHGFCLLNNLAIAAAYAMNVHRCARAPRRARAFACACACIMLCCCMLLRPRTRTASQLTVGHELACAAHTACAHTRAPALSTPPPTTTRPPSNRTPACRCCWPHPAQALRHPARRAARL